MEGEAEVPESRRWWGLVVLCAAMFISGVDTTSINLALANISHELGAGIGELQWIVDAFLVALATLLLVGSGLGDRFGRRRVFRAGFVLFAAASIFAALASTPGEVIAARAVMGVATACIMPTALSMLAVMFPAELRSRAIGIWAGVAGVAVGVGPVLGGILVAEFDWPSVFLINVPVAVAAVIAAGWLLPESTRPGAPPIDVPGAALSVVGLAGIVFALIEGPTRGWTSPPIVAAIAVGVLGVVAFVLRELRARHPMLDVRGLALAPVSCGAASILALYVSFLGLLFVLPQYIQYVQDRGPEAAGLSILPLGASMGVAGPLASRFVGRIGASRTLFIGLLGSAAGSSILLFLAPRTPPALILGGLAVYGFMLSITMVAATGVIMDALGPDRAGDGGAINQLARQMGAALGVAIVGSVLASTYRAGLDRPGLRLGAAERAEAGESIEDAARVAAGLGGRLRDALVARADEAFDAAARLGIGVCVGVLLLAALIVLVGLRAYRPCAQDA